MENSILLLVLGLVGFGIYQTQKKKSAEALLDNNKNQAEDAKLDGQNENLKDQIQDEEEKRKEADDKANAEKLAVTTASELLDFFTKRKK